MTPGTHIPGAVEGGDWNSLYALQGWDGRQFDYGSIEDFRKAVTAGYGSDVAALTGGGALRLQSLEGTLLTAVQENEDFALWNLLEKTDAIATVDEFSVKERIGGFPGSTFSAETDDIPENAGDYERRIGLVKYLMTKRDVTVVQMAQRTLVDTMADQNVDGTLELLTSAEWGFFYGDSSCSTVEFDGIRKQIEDAIVADSSLSDQILDMHGQSISPLAQEIIESAQLIRDYGRHGRLTHAFMSPRVQTDMDQKLDPAVRIPLVGVDVSKVRIGTPVPGVRTSFGNIDFVPDIFVQEGERPFEARGGEFAANVTAGNVTAPTSIAVASAAAPGGVTSYWDQAVHAGLFYWAVEGASRLGRSTTVKSAQVAVAVGDRAVVTITHGASNATHFVLYRSRKNGTDASSDLREMIRIPRSGGATTVYNDDNQNIPGTSIVCLLTMAKGKKAITLRRLMPLTKFPLYPTTKATRPWALLLFLYLRVGKRRQHRILKNVLPAGQTWRPFGV